MPSMPPATTMSASPSMIACAAMATVLRPEPHTLFTVVAGTWSGMPAAMEACRAGFMPSPAQSTFPMITSSTWSGWMPARFTASAMATAPSCVAGVSAKAPPKVPMGVRTPPAITTSACPELVEGFMTTSVPCRTDDNRSCIRGHERPGGSEEKRFGLVELAGCGIDGQRKCLQGNHANQDAVQRVAYEHGVDLALPVDLDDCPSAVQRHRAVRGSHASLAGDRQRQLFCQPPGDHRENNPGIDERIDTLAPAAVGRI